jgi:hypothetical protein
VQISQGAGTAGPVTGGQRGVPVLLSVNVGMPKNVPWQGKTVYTGVWKEPGRPGPASVNCASPGSSRTTGRCPRSISPPPTAPPSRRPWPASIGVTPVLSMLHQLAAAHSQRDIWWLHGARGPREHPFAAEAHALLASLPNAREHVFYSAATPADWSCRTGVCHTCVTPLLSGNISYAPDPLELPAGGQVLICCAQPTTDTILDL